MRALQLSSIHSNSLLFTLRPGKDEGQRASPVPGLGLFGEVIALGIGSYLQPSRPMTKARS